MIIQERNRLKKDNEIRRAAELKATLKGYLGGHSSRPSKIMPIPRKLTETDLKIKGEAAKSSSSSDDAAIFASYVD